MPSFDVCGLQREARAAAEAAAKISLRHLGDDLTTVAAHGSAVKGGFIAGCSDIDLCLYLAPSQLAPDGALPSERALPIYHDLARLDTRPFRYLQVYVLGAGKPARGTHAGLIPGAYHIIYGAPCVPLATVAQLRRSARTTLARLDAEATARRIGTRLLSAGQPSYARELRWLCTDVWPALYHVLVLAGHAGDPYAVWRLTKPEAIARAASIGEVGRTIRHFAHALSTHYATGETLPTALAALEAGVAFLRVAQCWYSGKEEHAR